MPLAFTWNGPLVGYLTAEDVGSAPMELRAPARGCVWAIHMPFGDPENLRCGLAGLYASLSQRP